MLDSLLANTFLSFLSLILGSFTYAYDNQYSTKLSRVFLSRSLEFPCCIALFSPIICSENSRHHGLSGFLANLGSLPSSPQSILSSWKYYKVHAIYMDLRYIVLRCLICHVLKIIDSYILLFLSFFRQTQKLDGYFLLQRIVPTQGLNPRLLQQQLDSLSLSHVGSPEENFSDPKQFQLKCQSLNCVQLFATHDVQPARLLCPQDSPGKNTGMGSNSLFQGIFLTQGSNRDLLHCKQILYHESPEKSFLMTFFTNQHFLISLLSSILIFKNNLCFLCPA